MGNYSSLNVLNQKTIKDYMSDDAIQEVAMMINSKNVSESEKKRLYRSLNKIENIRKHTQANLDRSALREYESCLDEVMLRFFSVLGIVLKEKYNYEESETKEEISNMFNDLNSQLEEFRGLTTDEVAEKCYEITGLQLIAEK